MDQNNSPNSTTPPENSDLAKQYQDILDRYSEELASQPPTPDAVPVVEQNSDPVPPETNEPSINQVDQTPLPTETPDNIDIPLTEVPPPILPAPETIPDIQPPIYESSPTDNSTPPVIPLVNSPMTGDDQLISSPKSSGGFFKFLFFVSLLIFLGVCAAIVYSILFDSNSNNNSVKPAAIQSTPSPISTNVCELNDKKYGVGESFEAADGCNTCTCTADLLFVCTELACDITPTVSTTSSAKITPTKSASKKLNYNLPDFFQTVKDESNIYQLGYNPELYTSKVESGSLNIIGKNLSTDPKYFYSPYSHTTNFKILPYDNGSRHTFIEKQLGESLSSTDQPTKIVESDYLVAGKNCLIISGVYISQSPTVWGMCPISATNALLFSSFDLSSVLQHLSTLKLL